MLQNSIIPSFPVYAKVTDRLHELNCKGICVFAALGFFLDKDTYWMDEVAVSPATNYCLNSKGELEMEEVYFNWHYAPRSISFETAVDEFAALFESSFVDFSHKNVVLPLSGGLDSRTIACVLQGNKNVKTYTYKFAGGIDEIDYAAQIADLCKFSFLGFEIESGYLWREIDRLARINSCYAEFTHPRQMAIYNQLDGMGEVLAVGHGGDLFFDGMGVIDSLSNDEQLKYLANKLVRKGGKELADSLWKEWGLGGSFMEYLMERLETLLGTIKIENANARLRAFKSKYYVPRWTQVNMQIFTSKINVFAPYFTDAMCNFICSVPEEHLKGRKIQIEYLKRHSPNLAKIVWQSNRPFNLYTYKWNVSPWNLPFRAWEKMKRINGEKIIERNWELQFLGAENQKLLKKHLFYSNQGNGFISNELKDEFLNKFNEIDAIRYSHPLSMLLTLSKFSELYLK